jgi:hypothetical protein
MALPEASVTRPSTDAAEEALAPKGNAKIRISRQKKDDFLNTDSSSKQMADRDRLAVGPKKEASSPSHQRPGSITK